MKQNITASKLYDYLQCPHRVWRDVYGPQDEKIQEANPFVELLWKRGVVHEERIVKKMGESLDLSKGSHEDRFQKTMQAIKNQTPLIYQGVLKHENDLGIPDLLQRMPDGKYLPIDIKSGSAIEGVSQDSEEEGKPKPHYAVQLCFYIELLQKLGLPNTGTGKIIDIHKNEVQYELHSPMGKRNKITWWEFYEQSKNNVQVLLSGEEKNKPAMSGVCKLCPWYGSCKKWCKENEDLSNIFYVGRSQRDVINQDLGIEKMAGVTDLDIDELMNQKKKDKQFLRKIGKNTLEKIVRRSTILTKTKKPVVYRKIEFPNVSHELFFDIEDDPTQEFVYMHGVYERSAECERFIHFTAKEKTQEAEQEAFANFWKYIRSLPQDDFSVYYYSHHEKTTYRKMQKLYPSAVTAEEVESFFNSPRVIDLYQIVQKDTDWPVSSYSLKELAQYLGFSWRDETPSGALSIQWFNEYLETGDEKILQRILLYNEDDCKATMVLKDGIEKLSISKK
ncbi:MAG: TM0106 family RecB-like putative nuclease [Candidatus Moranbacteria bacterium]|nr:TM0106 family RecB-like putative nuclease [Candidatus Moranbacteria bacterium]